MDEWQPARILTAAEFVGRFVSVTMANVARGDVESLLLKVWPNTGPGIASRPYVRRDAERGIPVPVEWNVEADPWQVCQATDLNASAAQPAFDIALLACDLPSDVRGAATKLAERILAGTGPAALDDANRAALRAFLVSDFDELTCSELVHGDAGDDSDALTLAAAQALHQSVASGRQLSAREQHHATTLLRSAPWQFGYWGPFKALVKSVPADSLTDAYADALARLSSLDPSTPDPAEHGIEDVHFLDRLVSAPSKKTRTYLARRARRDLASLAEESSDLYARVAARMLMSWDEPLSGRSYAPAYVMLGAERVLDEHSEYVRTDIDMIGRRDPHPEVWNSRHDLVREVFASVRSSVEALTWAYQILDDGGTVPEIAPEAVGLALASAFSSLRRNGCAVLPQHPELFDSLATSRWVAFFETATGEQVAQVADALAEQSEQPSTSIREALIATLAGVDRDSMSQVALLYLALQKRDFKQHTAADSAAVTIAISEFQLGHQDLWNPVVERMLPQQLLEVYRVLVEGVGNDNGLRAVADALVKKNWLTPVLAITCLGSDNARMVDLGWRLVEAAGGRSFLFERLLQHLRMAQGISADAASRIVAGALPQAATIDDAIQLAKWGLSTELEPADLAGALSQSEPGRGALWTLLAEPADGSASDLAMCDGAVLTAVGDSIEAQQLRRAAAAQVAFVLRYVKDNPHRIARDTPFGIAALDMADRALQDEVLRQIAAADQLSAVWARLRDTGLPKSFDAVRAHIRSLGDSVELGAAVAECLSSAFPEVRKLGFEVFGAHTALAESQDVWAAMAGLDNPQAERLVAEAGLIEGRIDDEVLSDFDRQILTARRPSRYAKALVQKRLESVDFAQEPNASVRIGAMLDMARHGNAQDREWAFMRLAALALQGVPIAGLEVSLTTEGSVKAEDVTA